MLGTGFFSGQRRGFQTSSIHSGSISSASSTSNNQYLETSAKNDSELARFIYEQYSATMGGKKGTEPIALTKINGDFTITDPRNQASVYKKK